MMADISWDNIPVGAIEQHRDDRAAGIQRGSGIVRGSGSGRGSGRGRHDDMRSADAGRGGGRRDGEHHERSAPGIGRSGRGRHHDEHHDRSEEFRGKQNDVQRHGNKAKMYDIHPVDARKVGDKDQRSGMTRGPEKGHGKDGVPKRSFDKGRNRDQVRNREKDRHGDRGHERERGDDRSRAPDRDRDHSRERGRGRDRDGSSSQTREKGAEDRDDQKDGSRKNREPDRESRDRDRSRERSRGISRYSFSKDRDGSSKGGRKLEWWEEEMPMTLEEIAARFTCMLCNVKCGGPKNYKEHLAGVTHKMRAQVFPDEDPARREEDYQEEEYQEEEWEEEEEELTLEDRMKKFHCALCDVQTTSEENLTMHNDGMRHKANIARQEKGEDVIKGSRNKGNRAKKKKISVTGEEIVAIQPIIDNCKEPLVGLEMIIEYLRQEWQTEAYFYCTLCEAKFQQVNFMPHVTGYRHRYGYIKIKRPDAKDMCRVEPKEKEVFKELEGGECVLEVVPKRNRTAVLANLKKVCREILKEHGVQKMQKGPDPDPPEMPLNRLKKTMRADSQVKLKAFKPEDFVKPVSNPPPVPIGGVRRPAPKNQPKERVEERPTMIGYKPPDVPPPGMAEVPSDLPPDAPPPTAMMMRPGARPGLPPVRVARPLPTPPRPPPRRPDHEPPLGLLPGLPLKSQKMRELEEEMEKEIDFIWSVQQEKEKRELSSLNEALEREKERRLLDARSVDIEKLRERDRSRLRERDPFLASYIEKGCPPPKPPKPEETKARGSLFDRPRVSQDLKDLYEKKRPSTSRSMGDEDRVGKKESSSSSRVLEEVVGALSKSLAKSDEDTDMALKVSSALHEALLNIKKKEEESRTAVDFPHLESEGPPPPPPGDAEMPPLPSHSPPPTQPDPQQRYVVPPLGSYQQAPQPVPPPTYQQPQMQQAPQPAAGPLGGWETVNPSQPQYQPGYPYTMQPAAAQSVWGPQLPPHPMAQHQYMPPYGHPEPEPPLQPPGESNSDMFSF